MSITAIYPGTFDPITNGHCDVARRASKMFDRVIVAIASNPDKNPCFSLEKRADLVREVMRPLANVEVRDFSGLLVDCAKDCGASVIVRGLRAVSDFEYEVQLAGLNRQMCASVETVFIAAAQEYAFLSSSMVRQIAELRGDVSNFVPTVVLAALHQADRCNNRQRGIECDA